MAQASPDLVKKLKALAASNKEERAKSDALFSSIGEGAVATDAQGYILRANQAALDILGYSKRELINKWFPSMIIAVREDGSAVDGVDRPITRVFITGGVVSERMYYQRKDGSVVPVAITVSPIYLKGKPVGAIEIFRNISAEIANDQMKTDFISIASHQLRTPLSSINTYSHMLAEGYAGSVNDQQAHFIGTILAATDKMNELISTLLNITRIEGGNISVVSKSVDLREVLTRAVAELAPQVKKKHIKLSSRASKNLPIAHTDPLSIGEIVSNLLSNAIKYTPSKGSIDVSLSMRNGRHLLKVSDTGYGIPISVQSQVFTKFFRASNVIKREVSGTGLGLYLIKILADNIGADVWFESQENKGSTFYLLLAKKGTSEKKGKFSLDSSKVYD